MAPGSYSAACSMSGYDQENATVNVTGGNSTRKDFVLDFSSSRGAVSGTIVDASGRPAYRIRVYSEGPSYSNTYTKSDGRYILPNRNAGTI